EAADQRDEEVLRLWQVGRLEGCPDVTGQDRQLFDEAARRCVAAQRLREAVEARDLPVVVQLAGDPALAGYPPVEGLGERLRFLLDEERRAQAVIATVCAPHIEEAFARLDVDLS